MYVRSGVITSNIILRHHTLLMSAVDMVLQVFSLQFLKENVRLSHFSTESVQTLLVSHVKQLGHLFFYRNFFLFSLPVACLILTSFSLSRSYSDSILESIMEVAPWVQEKLDLTKGSEKPSVAVSVTATLLSL